jgi:hypothetical protein
MAKYTLTENDGKTGNDGKTTRHNQKYEGTDLTKLTIRLPSKLIQGMDNLCNKRKIGRPEFITKALRSSTVSEKDFNQVMFELNLSLKDLVKLCWKEQLEETVI